jgi:hypothetical protein
MIGEAELLDLTGEAELFSKWEILRWGLFEET